MTTFSGTRDTWRLTAAQLDDSVPDQSSYQPEWWSIHWGGVGPYFTADWDETESLLRKWWAYHTISRGWSDIAYNYSAPPRDGTSTESMRLRGERPNGAQSNSSTWGPRTRTYVFPCGSKGPLVPSENQLRAFARMWQQDPLPVRFHRDFPDQHSVCPGDGIVGLIANQFWLDYLEPWTPHVDRTAGANRYATAAAVSQANFVEWEAEVLIATGENFPDALAAGSFNAPVLLTARDNLPPETAAEIKRLKATGAHIIGGPAAVSYKVQQDLEALFA